MAMFQAKNGKVISVGSGIANDEMVKKAKSLGMPIYTNALGSKTLLQTHMAPGGNVDSSRRYMDEKILGYLKQLDRTKPIVIHISDHGWNDSLTGDGSLPPEKSGIQLRNQAKMSEQSETLILTHEELAGLMKKAGLVGPGAPQVRIVSDHCYGGGIHWISENFPNVCTAAFTSNELPNYVVDDESRAFWEYAATEKKAGRKATMTSAFNAGLSQATQSRGAALGSTQYVQNILRKKKLLGKQTSIADDTLTDWREWDRLNQFKSAESCSMLPTVPPISGKQLVAVQDVLDTLYPPGETEGKEYQKALAALKKTGAADQKLLQQYQAKLKDAQAKWAKLTLEEKAIRSREYTDSLGDFAAWTMGDFKSDKQKDLKSVLGKEKNFESEFMTYKKANYPRIREYLKNRELVARAQELKTFADLYEKKKISEKEMDTYRRMVACESSPL